MTTEESIDRLVPEIERITQSIEGVFNPTPKVNPYIEITKNMIIGIPKLKAEIEELKEQITKQSVKSEVLVKRLQIKVILLKHIVATLESYQDSNTYGLILRDYYFLGLHWSEICKRAKRDRSTVFAIVHFKDKGGHLGNLEQLGIMFFGGDACFLE